MKTMTDSTMVKVTVGDFAGMFPVHGVLRECEEHYFKVTPTTLTRYGLDPDKVWPVYEYYLRRG